MSHYFANVTNIYNADIKVSGHMTVIYVYANDCVCIYRTCAHLSISSVSVFTGTLV